MSDLVPTRFPLFPSGDLDDLHRRLDGARVESTSAPTRGITTDRVTDLARAWRNLDRSAIDDELAALGSSQWSMPDGRRLHFLHRRGERLPVLLVHGWPDSPLVFRHLIPVLEEAGHPVVAPALPGFCWSDEHTGETSTGAMAADLAALMSRLGYSRYAVHGHDWGATIAAEVAATRPEQVAALHLHQPPFDRAFLVDRSLLEEEEQAYLTAMDAWAQSAIHLAVHMRHADTHAAALSDSPWGLLAWLADKYDSWAGEPVKDEDIVLSAAVMWLSRSVRSSIRLYSEPETSWDAPDEGTGDGDGSDGAATSTAGELEDWAKASAWGPTRIETPTAFAVNPNDLGTPPRRYCERFFAVRRYTILPGTGHWPALEDAPAVASDLTAFLEDV